MTIKYGLQFFFFFELTDNDGQNFFGRHSTFHVDTSQEPQLSFSSKTVTALRLVLLRLCKNHCFSTYGCYKNDEWHEKNY
jgi:hypothetical protein